jgi:cytochrome c biogenesis factor
VASIGSWALVLALAVSLYGAMAAFAGMRQRSRRFTESAEKAVWTVALLLVLAYPFLKKRQGEES